jgi:hypothetical protein
MFGLLVERARAGELHRPDPVSPLRFDGRAPPVRDDDIGAPAQRSEEGGGTGCDPVAGDLSEAGQPMAASRATLKD